MVCLGFEPGTMAQTNPLSYGGLLVILIFPVLHLAYLLQQ